MIAVALGGLLIAAFLSMAAGGKKTVEVANEKYKAEKGKVLSGNPRADGWFIAVGSLVLFIVVMGLFGSYIAPIGHLP